MLGYQLTVRPQVLASVEKSSPILPVVINQVQDRSAKMHFLIGVLFFFKKRCYLIKS